MSKMFVACHSWSHVVSQPFSALSFDLFCWICSILLALKVFVKFSWCILLCPGPPIGVWLQISCFEDHPRGRCLDSLDFRMHCLAMGGFIRFFQGNLFLYKWWVSSHGFESDSRSRWMWCKWTRPRLSGLALASRQVWAWNEKPEMLFRAWSGVEQLMVCFHQQQIYWHTMYTHVPS